MENKEVKIQKIPLDTLIETLVSLYNQGIDYIDISGTPGTAFDSMAIVFTEDYMTEEGKKNFGGEDVSFNLHIETNKLTDDDINQLI